MTQPRSRIIRIAITQMTSTDDHLLNLARMKELALEAASGGACMVFFPENALYFRVGGAAQLPMFALEDEIWQELGDIAKTYNLNLFLGSVAVPSSSGLPTASTVWISPLGKCQVVYSKTHMFDVDVAGQMPVRESEVFKPGTGPASLEVAGVRLGFSICYDVRFSNLYAEYARKEVDLILVPSAFLTTTGQAHWEVLVRARAIESQAFLVAPAQVGTHRSNAYPDSVRKTHGHSMVVNPWGQVMVDMGETTGVHCVDIDLNLIESVRQQIPMKQHRRTF